MRKKKENTSLRQRDKGGCPFLEGTKKTRDVEKKGASLGRKKGR